MNLPGGIWNYMEARRRRKQMETAAFFGIGCGAFLVCGLVVVIVGSNYERDVNSCSSLPAQFL